MGIPYCLFIVVIVCLLLLLFGFTDKWKDRHRPEPTVRRTDGWKGRLSSESRLIVPAKLRVFCLW